MIPRGSRCQVPTTCVTSWLDPLQTAQPRFKSFLLHYTKENRWCEPHTETGARDAEEERTAVIFNHRAGKHGDILNPSCDVVADKASHLEVTVRLSLADEVWVILHCCKLSGPPEGGQMRRLRILNSLLLLS